MAITGNQKAYTWARSGIARSGATRSNYVLPQTAVDWIVRDGSGNITGRTNLLAYIRAGSLTVSQALNDEPDTCSFQLIPQTPPAAVPHVGSEIQVSWTSGNPVFRGYALILQFDRRPKHESPWIAVQCQDSIWRFDARIVTYRFPAQSVSTSIAFLIRYFCNPDPSFPDGPLNFTTTYVQPNLPSIPAVDIINERPTTVLRQLMAVIDGGFYIDGLDVHAWQGAYEPAMTNPTPLTNALPSLKSFRLTKDATQLRRKVIVEGRRTSTLIAYPTMSLGDGNYLGLPVQDASMFAPATGPDAIYETRIGTQWMLARDPVIVMPQGANPLQTRVATAYAVGTWQLYLDPVPVAPPAAGWVKVGGQYARYGAIAGNPLTGPWYLALVSPTFSYGILTVPVPVGETVTWVDAIKSIQPHYTQNAGDAEIRAHPVDTPVVTFAEYHEFNSAWPPIESLVQDGRYSYAGALARAQIDVATFKDPLVSVDWETEDLNAIPGRPQVINLTGVDPVSMTLTILRVDLTFPLRTLPPRRVCTAGTVKPSTLLDVIVTSPE
jgi:hypothetical protein